MAKYNQMLSRAIIWSGSFVRLRYTSVIKPMVTAQYHSMSLLETANQHALSPSFLQIRWKAKKSKKEKAGKGKGHRAKMTLSDEEMNSVIDYAGMKEQMEATLVKLKKEYQHHLSLRTNVGVFDHLEVKTDDGTFPLIQLGQIVQKSPQLIVINMVASPQYIPQVKASLESSGLNLNPQQDGTSLFVPLPKVTMEYREGLAKNAKKLCNQCKDDLRIIQNKYQKIAAKTEHESEDLIRSTVQQIHMLEKDYALKAEDLMKAKQKELLGQ